jgi:hypothetical protein
MKKQDGEALRRADALSRVDTHQKHTAPGHTRRRREPNACFAAGTLVHIKEGLGWTPAEDLKRSSRENLLENSSGRSLKAHGTRNIYISDQPGVGWLSSYDNDTEAFGALWDFINNRFVAADVVALDKVQHHQISYNDPQFGTFPEELYLHLPVYNLEVEDFHTYYVGEHGVWVHNKNFDGLAF